MRRPASTPAAAIDGTPQKRTAQQVDAGSADHPQIDTDHPLSTPCGLDLRYQPEADIDQGATTVYVRNVAAGDTVRRDETTLLDAPPSGQGRCVITSTVVS